MTWTIDKGASKIGFSIKHMMISTVRGSFTDYECDLSLSPEKLESSSVSAKIDVTSVKTGDKTRDTFLVSNDFFRPSEFPFITFESTGVRPRGSKLSLVGKLKIRDKERSVTLEGSYKGPKPSTGEKRRMSFSLKTQVERDSFSLSFNPTLETGNILVGNALTLILEIELIEE
jgi:polyisoprenoid-binding protein YceI